MDEKAHSIVIPVKGLPREGKTFNFAIDGEFFQAFGNTQIKDADCTVKAEAIRRGTIMRVLCRAAGFVVVECDRCLDDLALKVDMERELTVGFGSVDIDSEADEDDVVVVDENEGEVDVSQFVYDYICLGLPIMKVHPEGKCNPEMLKHLAAAPQSEETAGETPFSGLKDLLKNK
ncbi:MAG: DUF177 domain-containing protein [Bacteroidales bacterium]|nr:DUF177 domain-containing protein [Bacteroidales bacterium]